MSGGIIWGAQPHEYNNREALSRQSPSPLPLDVLHDAHAAGVAPPRDHAHVSDLELDGVDGLARLEVHLDGVVHLLVVSFFIALRSIVIESSRGRHAYTRCG